MVCCFELMNDLDDVYACECEYISMTCNCTGHFSLPWLMKRSENSFLQRLSQLSYVMPLSFRREASFQKCACPLCITL